MYPQSVLAWVACSGVRAGRVGVYWRNGFRFMGFLGVGGLE